MTDEEFLAHIKTLTLPKRSRADVDPKNIAPTLGGVSVSTRERQIHDRVHNTRKNLHRKNGLSKDGNMRHVASIPVEVFEHVRRRDGNEAAEDVKFVLNESKRLGVDCQTGGKS